MTWTPERIETLTGLWGSGESVKRIGAMLGLSKGAVTGKAHRLGLPGRGSPIKDNQTKAPAPRKGFLTLPKFGGKDV